MKTKVHAIAGIIGFLAIATFWITTLLSELFGAPASITSVKHFILWGMLVLIPAMAVTGGSGLSLSGGRRGRLINTKKKTDADHWRQWLINTHPMCFLSSR